MHRSESNLGYFLGGIAMGAVVGIILAPSPGPDTRRFLRRQADAGADYMKRRTDEMSRNAIEAIDRGRKSIQAGMDGMARMAAAVCR